MRVAGVKALKWTIYTLITLFVVTTIYVELFPPTRPPDLHFVSEYTSVATGRVNEAYKHVFGSEKARKAYSSLRKAKECMDSRFLEVRRHVISESSVEKLLELSEPFFLALRIAIESCSDAWKRLCVWLGKFSLRVSWVAYVRLRVFLYAKVYQDIKLFIYKIHRYFIPELYGIIHDFAFQKAVPSIGKVLSDGFAKVFGFLRGKLASFSRKLDSQLYLVLSRTVSFICSLGSVQLIRRVSGVISHGIALIYRYLIGPVLSLSVSQLRKLSDYVIDFFIRPKCHEFWETTKAVYELANLTVYDMLVRLWRLAAEPVSRFYIETRDSYYAYLVSGPSSEEIDRLLSFLAILEAPEIDSIQPIEHTIQAPSEKQRLVKSIVNEFTLLHPPVSQRIVLWESIVSGICQAMLEDFFIEHKEQLNRFMERVYGPVLRKAMEKSVEKIHEFARNITTLEEELVEGDVYITNEALAILESGSAYPYRLFKEVYSTEQKDKYGYSFQDYERLIHILDHNKQHDLNKTRKQEALDKEGIFGKEYQSIVVLDPMVVPQNSPPVFTVQTNKTQAIHQKKAQALKFIAETQEYLRNLTELGLDIVAEEFNRLKFRNLDMIEFFGEVVLSDWKKQLVHQMDEERNVYKIADVTPLIELLDLKASDIEDLPTELLASVVSSLKRALEEAASSEATWDAFKKFHRIQEHIIVSRYVLNDFMPDMSRVYGEVDKYRGLVEETIQKMRLVI